jgi:hypothetical protein
LRGYFPNTKHAVSRPQSNSRSLGAFNYHIERMPSLAAHSIGPTHVDAPHRNKSNLSPKFRNRLVASIKRLLQRVMSRPCKSTPLPWAKGRAIICRRDPNNEHRGVSPPHAVCCLHWTPLIALTRTSCNKAPHLRAHILSWDYLNKQFLR